MILGRGGQLHHPCEIDGVLDRANADKEGQLRSPRMLLRFVDENVISNDNGTRTARKLACDVQITLAVLHRAGRDHNRVCQCQQARRPPQCKTSRACLWQYLESLKIEANCHAYLTSRSKD